jgi:superoxide dismutase, Fe-Mn family
VLDGERLRIIATSNAGTPLASTYIPLLTIDVWEHAYYLDYQHRRLDYISAFMAHLVAWDFANRNLAAAQMRQHDAPGEAPSRWKSMAGAAGASIALRAAAKG